MPALLIRMSTGPRSSAHPREERLAPARVRTHRIWRQDSALPVSISRALTVRPPRRVRPIADRDGRALPAQLERDGTADASGAPGDDGGASLRASRVRSYLDHQREIGAAAGEAVDQRDAAAWLGIGRAPPDTSTRHSGSGSFEPHRRRDHARSQGSRSPRRGCRRRGCASPSAPLIATTGTPHGPNTASRASPRHDRAVGRNWPTRRRRRPQPARPRPDPAPAACTGSVALGRSANRACRTAKRWHRVRREMPTA